MATETTTLAPPTAEPVETETAPDRVLDKITDTGWPVVNSENYAKVIMEDLGVKPHEQKGGLYNCTFGTIDELAKFFRDCSVNGRRIEPLAKTFAHQFEVVCHVCPRDGEAKTTVRTVADPHYAVLAVVDDYVPVTVGWRAGSARVMLALPPAHPYAMFDSAKSAAKGGFTFETGLPLADIESLAPPEGIYANPRRDKSQQHLFVGYVGRPARRVSAPEVAIIRFHWREWLGLITSGKIAEGFGIDSAAVSATLLGFMRLSRLGLLTPS